MKLSSSTSRYSSMMFTDIVGYSSMVGKDERNALKLLVEHDSLIEPIINKNHGRIIKKIGDAIFAEFDAILDCIKTAIKIQGDLITRNKISRDYNQIIIRIGIHYGNVFVKGNDLFGNEVNICSRIESIAPHGGIAASNDIIKNMQSSNDFFHREIGFVKLKNIKTPKLLNKLYINEKDYINENNDELRKKQIEIGTNLVDINTYVIEDIYSIGLLVFKNASEKLNDDLGYIITDQIIAHFQKIKQINMPNINESLLYKDSNLPLSEIARRLEVNNFIYGNYYSHGDEFSIDFNMLDTTSGTIVLSNKFTGNKNNLGVLYGKIIETILSYFDISIPDKIRKLISKSMTDNHSALKKYYTGMRLIEKAKNKDDLLNAKNNFIKASKEDINFVESLAQLAITCDKLGFHHESDEYIQKALNSAESLGSEGSKAMVYNCAGILFKEWNKYERAIPYLEQALEIQVHLEDRLMEAKILNNLAGCFNQTEDLEYAEKLLLRSIEIKESLEDGKSLAYSYAEMGNAYLIKGVVTSDELKFLSCFVN